MSFFPRCFPREISTSNSTFFDPRFGVEFGGDLKTFWQALDALFTSVRPLWVHLRGRNLLTRVELLSGGTVADAV